MVPREVKCREADRRGSIAPHWLCDDMRCRNARQFAPYRARLLDIRHRPKILRGKSGASRPAVSRSIVSSPVMFSSCFGMRMRLRGQKRVPRPPASNTAHAGSACNFARVAALTGAPISKATISA